MLPPTRTLHDPHSQASGFLKAPLKEGEAVALRCQQIVSLVVVYGINGRECAGVCPGHTSTGEYRSLNRRRATA